MYCHSKQCNHITSIRVLKQWWIFTHSKQFETIEWNVTSCLHCNVSPWCSVDEMKMLFLKIILDLFLLTRRYHSFSSLIYFLHITNLALTHISHKPGLLQPFPRWLPGKPQSHPSCILLVAGCHYCLYFCCLNRSRIHLCGIRIILRGRHLRINRHRKSCVCAYVFSWTPLICLKAVSLKNSTAINGLPRSFPTKEDRLLSPEKSTLE